MEDNAGASDMVFDCIAETPGDSAGMQDDFGDNVDVGEANGSQR